MALFSVSKFCLFLVGLIHVRCCISDKAIDADPNLYLKRALSEFESQYESLVVDLKSEVENRKKSEAKLTDKINVLEHYREATDAKLLDEIYDLIQNRLQDMDEIRQLKADLELTKTEVGTLKLKLDKYETINSQHWKIKLDDTTKQPNSKEDQKVPDERILQTDMHSAFPDIVKENLADNGAFQPTFDPIDTGNRASLNYVNDKRQKAESNRHQLINSNGTNVAFFALLSNHSPKLQPGQDIVFNDVLMNIGNGYHNFHGNFVAPVAGVYVFHTSLLRADSSHTHARLVKGGQVLAMLDFEQNDDNVSQMVIIELEAGDDVAVQNADYPDRVFYGHYYSTFSGFLLYGLPIP